jgi:ribosomal protein S18 acetylase RimI-like enzyme
MHPAPASTRWTRLRATPRAEPPAAVAAAPVAPVAPAPPVVTEAPRAGRLARWSEDLRAFPREAALAVARTGPLGLWRELRRRTFDRVARRWHYQVFETELSAELLPPPDVPEGVALREAKEEGDWTALGALGDGRSRRRFAMARACGRVCVGAWRGARPIGYVWYATAETSGADIRPLRLPAGGLYMHLLWVDPRERGRGVGSALQRAGLRVAVANGIRRGWGVVESDNRSARSALARTQVAGLPARYIGAIALVHVLGRVWYRIEPAPDATSALGEFIGA